MSKWNTVVKHFNANLESSESEIQKLWVDIFTEIFGYGKLQGNIRTNLAISIGSGRNIKPDIVLRREGKNVCLIELKQETIKLSPKIENQLFSYLKQTKIKIGLIISDKIYLYSYQYDKNDSEQLRFEIPFVDNNIDGEFLINLLSYKSFDDKAITQFIEEKINHISKVKDIISVLSKNFVLNVLKDYFNNQYNHLEIEDALNSIEIQINAKHNILNKIQQIKQLEAKSEVPKQDLFFEKVNKKEDIFTKIDLDILKENGRKKAIYIRKFLKEHQYVDDSFIINFATVNKNKKKYWLEPKQEVLKSNWLFILDDNVESRLYIFKILDNDIANEKFYLRHKGKLTFLELTIMHKDSKFLCYPGKLDFTKWLVKTIDYK
ncbi:Uncharacterised protein [Mesomycoplasma conjunctivae]|uniref:Type I restriction enzyme R protein N-terminal domain-containing protein n=1 Tax=Mesomycoplasma conjunctivae (strain ATCC 25834 / NCTC 10147 / HRC/581) TaxID=572263 RepID=C5J775_MESCH|nr:type I restriction enzyme HsdR N-terminal domain-containing protein [Mesomycoplasma conjunctivae]CAT05338.1 HYPOTHETICAL PROTEIN MCJ_006440 [Mesomycoplasma conjunctivae]VEU66563.1 Uncharacterised protein [Mesomycoplasma conjunctivae]